MNKLTDPPPSIATTAAAAGYQPVADWAQLPPGYSWPEVAGVGTDSQDRVFVFNRGQHPVMVFRPDGSFLFSWGEGVFARPHGITIAPDDSVWCTDDLDHTVRKFTPEGRLLLTLGASGKPSATGAKSVDFRTIERAGPPFHYPTNLAIAPSGDLYITDGYGNARVHKFSADGQFQFSWGQPGDGPGEFHVPHGIAIDEGGTIHIADRENSRIQLFWPDGKYIGECPDVARPCQIAFDRQGDLWVAELGYRAGMWPGTSPPTPDATGGRASVFTRPGLLKARFGGGHNPTAPGDFFAPHDICIDSRGDVYVAEVVTSAGGNRGLVSPQCHSLQKLVRVHQPT